MFSLTNVPVPQLTPLGLPISRGFKYRVLGFNADTPLEEVTQMYAHRKSDVTQYRDNLEKKFAFVVCQVWNNETEEYGIL